MKKPSPLTMLIIVLLALTGMLETATYLATPHPTTVVHAPPPPAHDTQSETMTKSYVAALDVARVFGRAPGCADATPAVITAIATEAVNDDIDARILAALVATESACDPMAISHSGAVGLTQVNIKVWKSKYDFAAINLLNPAENLHTGGEILGGLIKQYGVAGGLRHYNGMGEGCPTCDDNYVPKILALAGRR
jgi:hypothetical protein